MGYDGKAEAFPFYDIPLSLMKAMKEQQISFYMLHTPLDHYGAYATSVNLSKALGLSIIAPFCEYEKIKAGVIAKTKCQTVREFAALVERTVGHEVKLRLYGESKIKDGLVAIAAGGGSYPFAAQETADLKINLFLTGFTRPLPHFEPTLAFHKIAKENKINVIGATHYSTEKFALIAMTNYFKDLGIPASFLEGKYYLEDL
jgi:putative NIF3 family GTP cyclohydrolase 1 type 2